MDSELRLGKLEGHVEGLNKRFDDLSTSLNTRIDDLKDSLDRANRWQVAIFAATASGAIAIIAGIVAVLVKFVFIPE